MHRSVPWSPAIVLIWTICILNACGGGSSATTAPAGSESVYAPGASVNAVGYSDAAGISLYRDAGQGMLLLADGAVVTGGSTARLGVKVSGGTHGQGRVFLSNGDSMQVEATKEGDFYVCDYPIDAQQLLIPILVQVIYTSGTASKEKFVLRTQAGPSADRLVRDGLGILVGKDILESAQGMQMEGFTINKLTPATATWRNTYNAALYGEFQELGNIPTGIALDDGIADGATGAVSPALTLKVWPLGLAQVPVAMGAMTLPLAEMVAGMAGDFGADLSGLDLDEKPVFLDVHGLPDATTDNVAAMALGLFTARNATKDGNGAWVFPTGVKLYPNNAQTHPALNLNAAQDLGASNKDTCLGVNLSMDNLSQFVGALLDGSITMDAASLPIPLAIPGYDNGSSAVHQTLKITIKKEGLAFDFRTATPKLMLHDMRMEYLENNQPKWQLSLDLCFTLACGAHTGTIADPQTGMPTATSNLDLYLTLIPELAKCHVMKDDLGIGIFDHSNFAVLMVDALKDMLPADNGADLMVSINLKDYGLSLSQASAVSNAGRCFLKMVTDSADLSQVAGAGLCFITSAQIDR